MYAINTFIYLEKSPSVVHFWSTKWVSDYPKFPSLKDTSKTVEKQERGRITLVIKDLQVSFKCITNLCSWYSEHLYTYILGIQNIFSKFFSFRLVKIHF